VTEAITFQSRDGLSLEGALDEPATTRAGLVLCHPHPRMGGTMDAPLLVALRDEMVGRGWSVLRFNFRGVGASEGRASLGVEEVADALGAIDALAASVDGPIALAGWSFGGAVAIRATAEFPHARGCAGIAPSVLPKEGVTAGLPDPTELKLEVPLLIVVGDNDDLVSPDAGRDFAERVADGRYALVPGANHFFWAKYPQLCSIVGDFLDEVV
jgi:alpha/beta superfamily hydrolase